MRRVAALGCVLALTSACGSTVAVSHTAQLQGGTSSELGVPGGTTVAGIAPGAPTEQGVGRAEQAGAVVPTASAAAPGATAAPYGVVPSAAAATTPISVGFVVQASTAALAQTFGTDNLQNGDERAMAEALVADVNAHGGIAGRTLKAVYFAFDGQAETDFDAVQQRACATFSEDNHVFAVLMAWHAFADHALESCLQQRGILAVNSAGILTGGSKTLQQLADVAAPPGLTLERQARSYVDALARQSFFGSAAKVGVIALDPPEFESAVKGTLVPELKRFGVTNPDVVYYPALAGTADVSRQSAAMSNAVLRFRAAGVNRVLFLQQGINGPFMFMRAADSQGYRPRYALSSTDAPTALVPNVPASQLSGAIGVGWVPVIDVPADHETLSAPGRRACLDLLRKETGEAFTNRTVEYVGLSFCDSLWFFQQVAHRAAAVDRLAFRTGVSQLGTDYASPLVLRSRFGTGQRDGAAAARDLRFDDTCSCFAYTGAPYPLS